MRPTRTTLLAALGWSLLGVAAALVRELQLPFSIAGGSLVVLLLVDVITPTEPSAAFADQYTDLAWS